MASYQHHRCRNQDFKAKLKTSRQSGSNILTRWMPSTRPITQRIWRKREPRATSRGNQSRRLASWRLTFRRSSNKLRIQLQWQAWCLPTTCYRSPWLRPWPSRHLQLPSPATQEAHSNSLRITKRSCKSDLTTSPICLSKAWSSETT